MQITTFSTTEILPLKIRKLFSNNRKIGGSLMDGNFVVTRETVQIAPEKMLIESDYK